MCQFLRETTLVIKACWLLPLWISHITATNLSVGAAAFENGYFHIERLESSIFILSLFIPVLITTFSSMWMLQ